jgi:hypothetical protein
MTYKGRSLDDMPLAAYSTGVAPDEADDEELPEPPHLSQQDAVALAMGMEPATAPPDPTAHESLPRERSMPRPSFPRPSLPRFSLPRISLRARRPEPEPSGALAAAMAGFGHAPLAPTPPSKAPRTTRAPAPMPAPGTTPAPMAASLPTVTPMAASLPTSAPMPSAAGEASAGAINVPRSPGGARRAWPALDLKDLGTTLRNPRAAARDRRVLAVGIVGVGLMVLGASVLLGGGPGGFGAADASPTAPGAAAATAPPGAATVTLTGSTSGTYELAGTAGSGRPTGDLLDAAWTDAAGSSLALAGRAGSGTRTTSGELVLTWTVMVDARPVTFTSDAGECTVGMAVKPTSVTGSFVCGRLTSDDGKVTLKVTGTYRT